MTDAENIARFAESYAAFMRITDAATAQRRVDELWTKTVNVISATGIRFISRSEVSERHSLVDTPVYRVEVRKPTHGSLESSLWPTLGRSILADAGKNPRIARQVLPVITPKVEWLDRSCVVYAEFYMFECDEPVIEIAKEIPK